MHEDNNQPTLTRDSPATGSRTVPRSTKTPTSAIETILQPFARSWAAMLLLIILAALGYEAHVLLQTAGSNVTTYVVSSGKNLDALLAASLDGARAHTTLQEALANILQSSATTRDQVIINTQKLTEILGLLQESINLLKTAAPAEETQIASLKRIELAIAELSLVMKQGQDVSEKVLERMNVKPDSPR